MERLNAFSLRYMDGVNCRMCRLTLFQISPEEWLRPERWRFGAKIELHLLVSVRVLLAPKHSFVIGVRFGMQGR